MCTLFLTMSSAGVSAGAVIMLFTVSLAQEILEAPENTTVFLDQTAVFRCEVTGGHVSWELNGRPANELISIALDDLDVEFDESENGNPLTILTIIARAEYDGTTVQCLVNAGFSDQSQIVSLSIQGLLTSVSDLRATSNVTSVTISWSPPFSLIPDIWYSVFIYNVTDENNPTAILCTHCTNITETHYTFTPDYLTPCHVYNFSVVPLNGAGQGESSDHVTWNATYDVQSLTVEEGGGGGGGGGGVIVRGEFLSGSRAVGCLVVFQGPHTSPDFFRVLQRTQSHQDSFSTTVHLPYAYSYTVYGYDVEEDGLPNTMPAVVLEKEISNNIEGPKLVQTPMILKNGSISRSGPTTINIDCEFSEVYPQALCVLVYRQYDSALLTVVELPQLFPVSITVESPENYTFALFGKDGEIGLDAEPLFYAKFAIELPDEKGETDSGEEETDDSQTLVVAISSGSVAVFVLVCGSAVLVLVIIRLYCNQSKSTHTSHAVLQTRNVEYDEVVLSPTTASIPTEHNKAYVTTTPIPTNQNVAYGIHSTNT